MRLQYLLLSISFFLTLPLYPQDTSSDKQQIKSAFGITLGDKLDESIITSDLTKVDQGLMYLISPPNEADSDWDTQQCPRHVASTVGAKYPN